MAVHSNDHIGTCGDEDDTAEPLRLVSNENPRRLSEVGAETLTQSLGRGQYGFPDGLRQRYRAEQSFRKEVILAGFIDDPQKSKLLGIRVAKRDVDFRFSSEAR